MFTLSVLIILIVAIAILALIAFGAGGIILLLVFGDVIFAGLIIYLIIRAITKK